MSIPIIDAILAIKTDAKVAVRGDDVDRIEWIDGETPISKSEILAKQTELQTEYDAQAYARNRAQAYASTGDQLDMQYWDNVNGTTTWRDHITEVKARYPK